MLDDSWSNSLSCEQTYTICKILIILYSFLMFHVKCEYIEFEYPGVENVANTPFFYSPSFTAYSIY